MVEQQKRKFRTAVLVVHGMGSQRPLETVRGVVDAVWFDHSAKKRAGDKRIWTHPEPSGVDIDLTVMTTSSLTGKPGGRTADFHELYWAHLMSETKAVAVLLWLFELARKGPRFTTALNALWYGVAMYLALLILSVTSIALRAIILFVDIPGEPQWLLYSTVIMLFVGVALGLLAAALKGAWRLAVWLTIAAAALVAFGAFIYWFPNGLFGGHKSLNSASWWASVALPLLVSLGIGGAVMKKRGILCVLAAYAISWPFLGIYLLLWRHVSLTSMVAGGHLPWSMDSDASLISAFVLIAVYVAINAAFLQPYLGDAARYFRSSPANIAVRREMRKQAVDTLDQLHRLRIYDRIIVVAHSLGSVVAYDMLRAYYSRICDLIVFQPDKLQPELDQVDKVGFDDEKKLTPDELRAEGRKIIRKMAENIPDGKLDELIAAGKAPEAWLVTDFVTMGSPLTHARYLMCNGDSFEELNEDFQRRLEEREFPSCPPSKHPADPDGWLTFVNPRTQRRTLHHGGLFALTRWTNLYFRASQLFWGDPVGGPVGTEIEGNKTHSLFGTHLKDQEVWLRDRRVSDFFTHTAYWRLDHGNGRDAPHIQALRDAINLEDKP